MDSGTEMESGSTNNADRNQQSPPSYNSVTFAEPTAPSAPPAPEPAATESRWKRALKAAASNQPPPRQGGLNPTGGFGMMNSGIGLYSNSKAADAEEAEEEGEEGDEAEGDGQKVGSFGLCGYLGTKL